MADGWGDEWHGVVVQPDSVMSADDAYSLLPMGDALQCALTHACADGDLNYVRHIVENKLLLDVVAQAGMLVACCHNHVDVLLWLLKHVPAPPPAVTQALLVNACVRGQGDVVRWVVTRMGADILANHAAAFRFVAHCGDLDLVKWVCSVGRVDIWGGFWVIEADMTMTLDTYGYHAILNAGHSGHLHIARWIAGLQPDYPWPDECMQLIKTWSDTRDAWMRAVARCQV